MPRTIIVTVGISLIADHLSQKEKPRVGFGQLGRPVCTLTHIYRELNSFDEDPGKDFDLSSGPWPAHREAIVETLERLWKNDIFDAPEKHLCSGAELASLHLLGRGTRRHDLFNIEDRVLLMASDTPSGQFCAAVIRDVLAAGLADFPTVDAEVCKVDGLNAKNAEDFLQRGLPRLAERIANQRAPRLLIASGGYKGVLPYLTPIAMYLQIPLLYLYENSNRLLEIRPLDLSSDRWVVDRVNAKLSQMDATLGKPPGDAATFWSGIDAETKRRIDELGLIDEVEGSVTLSSTGVLASLLYGISDKEAKRS